MFQLLLCLEIIILYLENTHPLWSYFGRDFPDNNRTKIGPTRFLTFFGSTMSGMQLASGNIENSP